jgi:hypothetical protein
MLKKFLTTAYLLALTAMPVQALPIWAMLIARSQCEYLAMGVDWESAFDQSLRDNEVWADYFLNNKTASKAIVSAAYQTCPNLYQEAFLEYERQKSQPVYNNANPLLKLL